MTQISIDFTSKRPPEVQARIDEGMDRADENADGRWRHIIDSCVVAAARKKPEVTIDDVLDEYELLPESVRPFTHNMSALGPAMMRAKRMGIISPTDRVTRSRRAIKHGNRSNIWLSKYFRSAP